MTREKTLTDEDRILWGLVASTAKPLKHRRLDEWLAELRPVMPAPAPLQQVKAVTSPPPRRVPPPAPSVLDRPTLNKLAGGRLLIEARIDLHGMTQDEAYGLLYTFLGRAHARGLRYVMVITGKGSSSGGDGVLRRAVPGWLETAPFRGIVSSHDHAARHHGGAGALYVRLRKK